MPNTKSILNYASILKRSSCLLASVSEAANKSNDRSKYVERIIESIITDLENSKSITSLCEQNTYKFITEMSNTAMADKYYEYPLTLIEYYNEYNVDKANAFLNEFVSSIIPRMSNLDSLSEALSRHELIFGNQRELIQETIKQYTIIDRILENHNTISKRFNIENEVKKLSYANSNKKGIINNCCSMIDTYNLPAYQKFNICIEEMYYLTNKNKSHIELPDMVKYISEYFLMNNDILTSKDMRGIRKVLTENSLLTEEDTASVSFIVTNDVTSGSMIRQCIQSYLIAPEKSIELFTKTINLCLDCDLIDLSNNLGELLIFICDAYNSELYDPDDMDEALLSWVEKLELKLSIALDSDNSIDIITKEYVNDIFKQIEKAANYITYNDVNNSSTIAAAIDTIKKQLDQINSTIYTESNIATIEYLNSDDNMPILTSESKVFKKYNIIRVLSNIKENYIRYNSLIPDILDKINKSDTTLYEFVGEDNKLDITVGRIVCTDEDKFDHYSRSTSEICDNINRYLQSNSYDSVRCYYETNPYIISIHIKDATPLVLSENETNLVKSYKTKSEEINFYTDLLSYAESYSDIYEDFDIIDELLGSISEDSSLEEYSIDKFETLIEAASIIGVDAESITAYANKYSNLIYNSSILEGANYNSEKNMVTNIIEGYKPYTDAPMEDKVEALLITKAILSEANIDAIGKKKDDNKDNGDDNKGGGISLNLNKMKLYLQGLKTKFKDMTQKEKEISKKIDSTSKVLVKSLKDALISDRREAIIKGSVIPSFSKCMKIGVALAGIAKFGHPEIAAIAAIGGFIASKKLTKKERMLLLDEIEIELDVLEKEINNAESRGQMKKYRALQTQKKSLQRQYQRIKYNVRIGKEIMPNSEIGVKTTAS